MQLFQQSYGSLSICIVYNYTQQFEKYYVTRKDNF